MVKEKIILRAIFYTLYCGIVINKIIESYMLKSNIFNLYGSQIDFWKAFKVIEYNNYEALKLFLFTALLIIFGTISATWSLKISSGIVFYAGLGMTLVSLLFIIWLLIVMANPVLVAIFLIALAGGAFVTFAA